MEGARRPRTRAIGTGLAVGTGALFVAAIGFLILRARLAPPGPVGGAPIEVPELHAPPEELGSVAGSSIEVYDRKDPTRLAARLLSKRTDPVPERRGMVEMEEPEAWIYARDGRSIRVQAARGLLYMPDSRREPESGTISGGVVISVYAPQPPGTVLDPATAEPEGTLRTESLTFDGGSLELSTLDRFEITSRAVSAAGQGLTLILNEVKERIELLEVRRGESITYTPGSGAGTRAAAGPGPSQPSPVAGGTPGSGADGAPAPPAPRETFYHVVFSDAVEVTHGERVLRADRLITWARLLDNRLPENAVARLATMEPTAQGVEQPEPTPQAVEQPGGPVPAPPPAPIVTPAAPVTGASGAVVMKWSGSCIVRPLDAPPPELVQDHLALRATAEKTGLVTFADPVVGGEGHCATLDYGLTTGSLNLTGIGPASVALALGKAGKIDTIRLALDLRTLVGTIPTPGVITAAREEPPDTPREQVSWAESCRFVLDRDPAGGIDLSNAAFIGKAQATDGKSSIRADYLHAAFTRAPDGATILSRLRAEDRAGAEAHKPNGDRVRAERLEVEFRPGADPRKPDPVLFVAQGSVEIIGRGSEVHAGYLEADLVREADGSIEVAAARVRDGFRFARDEDGVTAAGDEANVDAKGQIADVLGEGSFVGADRTRILGSQIRLDGAQRTVTVFGGWTFEQGEPRAEGAPALRATGTAGLTFDDASGVAEGAGGVVAVNAPDALTHDRLGAERVRLEFTPAPPADAPPGGERPKKLEERKLLRATAIGGVLENEGGANATAEVLRWAADPGAPGGRRLVRALRVEAPSLAGDDQTGTLDAPGAGKLLVRDYAPEPREHPDERAPAAPMNSGWAAGDFRGDSLFTWEGSMHLDRAAGTLEMQGNTSLTHMSLAYDRVIRLIAERMSATIRAREGSLSEGGASDAELLSASARGAVHATIGTRNPKAPFDREMVADRVDYDAAGGILEATAHEGNLVTLFDGARGTATSAESITWNVARDEVKFVRAQPVVIPR